MNLLFVITISSKNKIQIPSCHDMKKTSMSLNDVVNVTVERNDYRIYFWGMAKTEAMNRIKNTGLSEKNEQLWYKKELLEEEKQKKKDDMKNYLEEYGKNLFKKVLKKIKKTISWKVLKLM